MNYDEAINLIWDAGFDEDIVQQQDFLGYIATLDPNIDITVQSDDSSGITIKIKISGGYAKIRLQFVEHNYLVWQDDDFIPFARPVNFRRRMAGRGMYESADEIPIYPHFAPGSYYRDKSGQLKDDEGHNLQEMDGIAFDNDANVIGYDPKVYPVAPTQLQIQQAKTNILTDHMMNAHEIIHNYESPPIPRTIPRTTRNVNNIGTRLATDWEIDEYIRNYKEPGM